MATPEPMRPGDELMSILQNDDSGLGYVPRSERALRAPARHQQRGHEGESVKPGDSHAEAGGTSYHVLFPIAVGAVFLATLVLGALLG